MHRHSKALKRASGANSAASLSMISTPRIVEEDLAKWENNSAGIPERQADSRASAFEWAKILKLSTPLYADTCRITRPYMAGTQERFHVPCPHCEHFQPLEWSNFQANINPENPYDAHFTCAACGAVIEHRDKIAIVPPELETSAEKKLATIQANTTADVNPFGGKFDLLVEARLSSTKRWYMSGDPARIEGLEFAYLAGEEGPQAETRASFEVDGV